MGVLGERRRGRERAELGERVVEDDSGAGGAGRRGGDGRSGSGEDEQGDGEGRTHGAREHKPPGIRLSGWSGSS
jgi:hypothetical protein